MRDARSPRRHFDLRRSMTDARQWLVEAEDNPFMTGADRVAELDALTARTTDGSRWWWQFQTARLSADTWRTVESATS